MQRDYYQVLGVSPTADSIVIRAAYKALMKTYHPDRVDSYQDKVKSINEAYECPTTIKFVKL